MPPPPLQPFGLSRPSSGCRLLLVLLLDLVGVGLCAGAELVVHVGVQLLEVGQRAQLELRPVGQRNGHVARGTEGPVDELHAPDLRVDDLREVLAADAALHADAPGGDLVPHPHLARNGSSERDDPDHSDHGDRRQNHLRGGGGALKNCDFGLQHHRLFAFFFWFVWHLPAFNIVQLIHGILGKHRGDWLLLERYMLHRASHSTPSGLAVCVEAMR
mmetsp:Transcript_35452/g.51810  ORF Transcript_35452/g.51810 Transcript_35452/m.51810 type:complete len:216 (-) Transcript_35452:94-741(-)